MTSETDHSNDWILSFKQFYCFLMQYVVYNKLLLLFRFTFFKTKVLNERQSKNSEYR